MARTATARLRLASLLWGVLILVVLVPPPPASAQVRPPVDGVVVDGFRPPAHIGAPGNRGWEYATTPGGPARAVLGGVVVFAGPVAGNLFVSVEHPGGLRTTYSFLAEVTVGRGQVVAPGTQVGLTAATFHFGLRRDGTYLDPAILFHAVPSGPPLLVPRPGRVPPRPNAVVIPGRASGPIPLHSLLGSIPSQQTFSPRATHGRRVSGVGPGIR